MEEYTWSSNEVIKETYNKPSSLYRIIHHNNTSDFFSIFHSFAYGEYHTASHILQMLLFPYGSSIFKINNHEILINILKKVETHPWLVLTVATEMPWSVVPFLIENEETVALAFERLINLDENYNRIVSHINADKLIDPVHKAEEVTHIVISLWSLFLSIRAQNEFYKSGEPVYPINKTAEIIAEILLSITAVYQEKTQATRHTPSLIAEYKNRLNEFIETLIKIPSLNGTFFFQVVDSLVEQIVYHARERRRFDSCDFSQAHLFLLFKILQFLNGFDKKNYKSINPTEIKNKICKIIIDEYIVELIRTKKNNQKWIIWHEEPMNLLTLEWAILLDEIDFDLLQTFLKPINFCKHISDAKADFNPGLPLEYYIIPKSMQTWVYRIRIHFRVLSLIFNTILGNKDTVKSQIREAIESELILLLSTHVSYNFDNGSVDLYDHNLNDFSMEVSSVLDKFEKEKSISIVRKITENSSDPYRLYMLSSNVISGSIKQEIEKLILIFWNFENLQSYFDRQTFLPSILATMESLAHSALDNHVVQEQLIRLIDYIEKERISKFSSAARKNWLEVRFHIQLQLAWIQKDRNHISNLQFTQEEKNLFQSNELKKNESLRDFYLGLSWMEEEPQKAYDLFDRIIKKNESLALVSTLNRFAAAIKIAEIDTDNEQKKIALKMALSEWENTKISGKIPNYLKIPIEANILHCLAGTGQEEKFNKRIGELTQREQISQEILPVLIQHHLSNKLNTIAEELIAYAEKIHRFNNKLPQWLIILKDQIQQSYVPLPEPSFSSSSYERTVEDYRDLYCEILDLRSNKFTNVVNRSDVGLYLLQRIVSCLQELRERKGLLRPPYNIEGRNKEDETALNTWLKTLLKQRLCDIGWKVEEGSSQGYSERYSKKNDYLSPGHPDITVRSRKDMEQAIIECLWFGNKPKDHSEKIHTYSDSKDLFLVIYCQDENEFNLNDYKKKVQNSGSGFVQFDESDIDVEYSEKSISICKAIHQISSSTITVYHILFLADFAVWKKIP